jgi:hypothetical protein
VCRQPFRNIQVVLLDKEKGLSAAAATIFNTDIDMRAGRTTESNGLKSSALESLAVWAESMDATESSGRHSLRYVTSSFLAHLQSSSLSDSESAAQ